MKTLHLPKKKDRVSDAHDSGLCRIKTEKAGYMIIHKQERTGKGERERERARLPRGPSDISVSFHHRTRATGGTIHFCGK